MENFKTYKQYFINNRTWKEQEKNKTISKILKATKEELTTMEEWQKRRLAEDLTDKQAKMLFNNDIKELKKLLTKYKTKAKEQLQQAKEKATQEYNDIKVLKDIKNATFEIEWTKNRGAYGYQCKCYAKVQYANDTYKYYESEKTGGCGYDKPSSALSYALNNTAKILLIKHGNKIINDTQKHYNCYACENLYFSYGVGVNSYLTMFKYFGYKVQTIYHNNEDITIIINK